MPTPRPHHPYQIAASERPLQPLQNKFGFCINRRYIYLHIMAKRKLAEAVPFRVAPPTTSPCDCVMLPKQGAAEHVLLPWVGFGTYKLKSAMTAVTRAAGIGYRSIDSAFIYGGEKTEPEIGAALEGILGADGGAPAIGRDSVFVTTKHWCEFHASPEGAMCVSLNIQPQPPRTLTCPLPPPGSTSVGPPVPERVQMCSRMCFFSRPRCQTHMGSTVSF